jgi:hypothetical protein
VEDTYQRTAHTNTVASNDFGIIKTTPFTPASKRQLVLAYSKTGKRREYSSTRPSCATHCQLRPTYRGPQTYNQTHCPGCRPRHRHQSHRLSATYREYNHLQGTSSSGSQQDREIKENGNERRPGSRSSNHCSPSSPIANLQSRSQESPKETSARGPARSRIHRSRKPAS